MSMNIDFKHSLSPDEAKLRIRALGDYLQNRHGINVTWDDAGERATVKGKYLVVNIDGSVWFAPGMVHFQGEDPGFLLRGKAKGYLTEKLEKYMDPKVAVDDLPRR